jgi:hypothetical protein
MKRHEVLLFQAIMIKLCGRYVLPGDEYYEHNNSRLWGVEHKISGDGL